MTTKSSKSASSNPARRSISIFSRKGCDTPSPVFENLPGIPDANKMTTNAQRQMRRASDTPKSSGKANGSKQRPVSLSGATPSKVLKNKSVGPALAFMNSEIASLVPKELPQDSQTTYMPIRKPVTQIENMESWNLGTSRQLGSETLERPKTSDGLSKAVRPKIQVMIPDNGNGKKFSSVPFLHAELARDASLSRPRIHNRSLSEISPPTVTSQKSMESFTVSAVSPSPDMENKLQRMLSVRRSMVKRAAEEPISLNQYLQVPVQNDSSHDGSSNDSISGDEDNISVVRSQRSSITSFDSQPEQISLAQPKPDKETKDEETEEFSSYKASKSESSIPSLGDLIHLVRTPSTSLRPAQPSRSLSSGNVRIPRTLPEAHNEEANGSRPSSPTLSEAERNLEDHLSSMSPNTSKVVESWLQEELTREYSIIRKPLPPPKSEKRMSRVSSIRSTMTIESSSPSFYETPQPVVTMQPLRNCSLKRSCSVRSVLSLIAEDDERQISSDEAERVIFLIMSSSHDLEDLFSLALINGGFYKVAKQHELELMQTVMKNMSPAAWEFRQCSEFWDTSAQKFYDDYLADSDVIGNIKILILERCQSILRPDTVKALAAAHKPFRVSRVDDALWRIWTFCKLFGGQQGREEDVDAQIDWLKGGAEIRSASANQDQFLESEYAAYEHFGEGNHGGLTADEVYDITELWNCVRTISQGVLGRTEQARQHGVFDDTEIRGGDIDGEEIMLEEWHSYLMTQGLSVIYEISKAATSLYAFSIAKRHRWTRWSPPVNGVGRRRFLLEPCGRFYESRISESLSPSTEVEGERRSVRRRRRESFADEIRQLRAKQAEAKVKPEPEEEKLMSRANSVLEQLSSPSSKNPSPMPSPYSLSGEFQSAVSPVTPSRAVPPILVHSPSRAPPPPPMNTESKRKELYIPTNLPILASSSSPSLPSPAPPSTPPPAPIPMHMDTMKIVVSPTNSSIHSLRSNHEIALSPRLPPKLPLLPPRLPTLPPRPSVNASRQHPAQAAMRPTGYEASMSSSDKAIFRIVEMGFTVEDAKKALRTTDMGDGLRIDRAVEYLLRQ